MLRDCSCYLVLTVWWWCGFLPHFFLSFSFAGVFFLAEVAAVLSRHSPLHVFLPGVEMALVYPERRRPPGVAVTARHYFPRPSLMRSRPPLVTLAGSSRNTHYLLRMALLPITTASKT